MSFPTLVDVVRAAAQALAGDDLWRGATGRALAGLIETLQAHGHHLDPFDPADAPGLFGAFLEEQKVRPPYGRHPRLAIYGQIEARLQRADLMILGGLNEGVWPGSPAPDPWLAPAARAQLGLPGLERRIGVVAHDFVQAMGAREVIVTRARRDATAPTVPSRFWLRLQAMAGDRLADDALADDGGLLAIARALDRPDQVRPALRPAPAPPAALRPRRISVTQADKLKADPYSFYAETMLRLSALKPLDEDPTAADRGTAVHRILETWVKDGAADPAAIAAFAERELLRWEDHPTMRALWAPRVRRAVDWVADTARAWAADGWTIAAAETKGVMPLGNGVTLRGTADRIDRDAAGRLAIVDYKTGAVPSHAQVEGGFAMQLGLLAWLADGGHFRDLPRADVAALRYWKLSGGRDPGTVKDPLEYRARAWTDPGTFLDTTITHFYALCDAYLLDAAPFTAKLHPEHAARYRDHDHLARVAEWQGRAE